MEQNRRNIPDFDDLIFESRNKEYGAYKLRKRYNFILTISILIASFIGCSAVIIPYIVEKSSNRVRAGGLRYVQVQMDSYMPPKDEYLLSSPPPPASSRVEEIRYIPPEVVDTINTAEKILATNDEALAHAGDTNIVGSNSGFGDDLLSGDGTGSGEVYFVVEQNPTFLGGDINKFRQWVQRRAVYPQEAIDNKIKGTVFITFIIEKDGSVSNVAIVNGVHPLLDTEALRVISSSPRWGPGLQRGQAVRVRYSISLTF